jgi:hypothetical protein
VGGGVVWVVVGLVGCHLGEPDRVRDGTGRSLFRYERADAAERAVDWCNGQDMRVGEVRKRESAVWFCCASRKLGNACTLPEYVQ